MKCKICKEDSHYCTSCDYDKYMMSGYCSKRCYEQSEEWKLFNKKVIKFYESLNKEQQSELWSLWDNGILIDDKWEDFLDYVFQNPYEGSKEPSTGD